MSKIIVKQDIEKDAWNWWNACNKSSYGVDWKQSVDKAVQNKLVGKTRRQAFIFLIPFLKSIYKKENIDEKKKEIQDIFDRNKVKIFSRMKKTTGKKIYRANFICFLTTFPRAPYNYSRGQVWLPIIWSKETYLRVFVHELLHFQTYAYWQKQCLKKLTREEFENLKEALTVVLNEEFMDLIIWPDKGYKIHKHVRGELLKFWKVNKDFDKLVSHGIKIFFKNSHP